MDQEFLLTQAFDYIDLKYDLNACVITLINSHLSTLMPYGRKNHVSLNQEAFLNNSTFGSNTNCWNSIITPNHKFDVKSYKENMLIPLENVDIPESIMGVEEVWCF